ncbi:MAG: hypothetical protein H0U51_10340 [Propionibacteriales bacterium]|jgi:hypothetical protein|nr:hypothetical protein [Propionibacteriales bacterium]
MKHIFMLVFLLVSGFGFFAALRWIPYFVRTRMEPFDAILTQAEVTASDNARTRLEAQAARRHVWSAVGAGAGFSVALLASLPDSRVLDGAAGLFSMAGWWFGMAVGQSLSALLPVNPPRGPVRVSAMQPHGMTDYMHRREVVAEVGLAVLGWVSVAVGALVLANLVDIPMSGDNAAALVLAGALLALVATTTIVGQRRLLAAPLRAQDEDGLICADIILAVGLRDLLATTMAMTVLVAWTTFFLPGRDWWLVATFTAAAVISGGTAFGVRKRPNLAPVARSLSARSRTA